MPHVPPRTSRPSALRAAAARSCALLTIIGVIAGVACRGEAPADRGSRYPSAFDSANAAAADSAGKRLERARARRDSLSRDPAARKRAFDSVGF